MAIYALSVQYFRTIRVSPHEPEPPESERKELFKNALPALRKSFYPLLFVGHRFLIYIFSDLKDDKLDSEIARHLETDAFDHEGFIRSTMSLRCSDVADGCQSTIAALERMAQNPVAKNAVYAERAAQTLRGRTQ